MRHVKGIGRVGLLAVGFGIWAAVAATPGIASADDMQISIDGMDLFPTAGNTATAFSGPGDIAIAIDNGNSADAGEIDGGQFDLAYANGTDSGAIAQFGNLMMPLPTGLSAKLRLAVSGHSAISLF